MDDFLNSAYQTYNIAAKEAIEKVAEEVAETYGEEGLEAFAQFLDEIPAEAVYQLDDPEKVASEEGIDLEKVAELDAQGRIFAHAFLDELRKTQKVAEFVGTEVASAFLRYIGEEDE